MKKFTLVALACALSACSTATATRDIASKQYHYTCTWKSGDSQNTLGQSTTKIVVGASSVTGVFSGLTNLSDGDGKPVQFHDSTNSLHFAATYNPNYKPQKKNEPSNMSQYNGDEDLGTILQGWDRKDILIDSDMRTGAATGHMRTSSLYDTSFTSDLFSCTEDKS